MVILQKQRQRQQKQVFEDPYPRPSSLVETREGNPQTLKRGLGSVGVEASDIFPCLPGTADIPHPHSQGIWLSCSLSFYDGK